MKKTLLTLTIALVGYCCYAQNTYPWPSSGNIGIGTTSPTEPLTVNGRILGTYLGTLGNIGITSTMDARIYMNNTTSGTGQNWNIISDTNGAFEFGIYGSSPFQTITSGGNVGIGTTTPDQKLAVNGTIHSKEVLVDLSDWSDYVFKPSYKLPALTTIKNYINKNHHLPDMPSAQKVKDHGINLGEIAKVQTKKIEELTLYLIEKDNQVNQLQSEMKQQKDTNNQLESRISALEAALIRLTSKN